MFKYVKQHTNYELQIHWMDDKGEGPLIAIRQNMCP